MQHSHDMVSDRQETGKGAERKGTEIWLLMAQLESGLLKLPSRLSVSNYARMVTCKTQNFRFLHVKLRAN
jgi:hypothetical protein